MTKSAQGNLISRFSSGFFSPFRAAPFLFSHPRLLKYVLVPFSINTVVFSLAVYFGLDFFNDVVVRYLPEGDQWYWLLLYYLLWTIAVLVTAVLVFFTFTIFGNLIAAPFNDLLSERTEETVFGHRNDEPFSWRLFWGDILRTVGEESKKMAAFVLGMVLLFLLNFLPGFGPILYAFLSFFFTLFFLAVEYTGFVFGRKRLTFKDQRQFVFGHFWLMAGFSLGVLALLTIPLVQFFCIPMAVVAATRLWCDHRQPAAGGETGGPGPA